MINNEVTNIDDTEEDDDDLMEEWDDEEDDEGFEEEDLVDIPEPKKGKGGLFFILFLLIIIGGLGGGYYYIHTPGGQSVRAMIPENILAKLPPLPMGTQTAATTTPATTTTTPTETQTDVNLAMDIPPMPSMTATDDGFDTSVNITDDQLPDLDNMSGAVPVNGMEDASEDAAATETEPADDIQEMASLDFTTTDDDTAAEEPTETAFDAVEETAEPVEDAAATESFEIAAVTETPVEEAVETTPVATEPVATEPVATQAAATETPVVKSEDLVNLEDRLNVLESAVAGIEKNMLTKSDLSDLRSDMKAMRREFKNAKARVSSAPVKSTQKSVSKPKTRKAASKPAPRKHWVLKAAQPGKAWIAEKGQTDSKTITVGSYVSGLGKIKSIEQLPTTGRWVVTGSKNTLHQ